MKTFLRLVHFLVLILTATAFSSLGKDSLYPPLWGPTELIINPSPTGHARFISSIQNAKKYILLEMYHLTDLDAINALVAAQNRGIDVHVILDRSSLKNERNRPGYDLLTKAHVQVRPSSEGFSITHTKTMIVDGIEAFVTSINLTNSFKETRDFGIVTTDPKVIAEINAVFKTDWENASTNRTDTPQLTDPNLVWSPVDATEKLQDLINSATGSIAMTVENLGDTDIEQVLDQAVQRGVKVELIVPMCDKNSNPLFNYPITDRLQQAGVTVKVMPTPSTPTTPYMHSKMILADGNKLYIGSINFSFNSMRKAREVGILLSDANIIAQVQHEFSVDWQNAVNVPNPRPTCPAEF